MKIKTIKVCFYLRYHTTYGQSIWIYGNHPLLGSGDPQKAQPLVYLNEDYWKTDFIFPLTDQKIEYHYILRDESGKEILESLTRYQEKYLEVKNLARQVNDLKLALKERDKELETLKEFADAINKVKPLSGELTEIENEISRLDSVEDIRIGAASAEEFLNGDEQNLLTQLISARKNLEGIKGKDAALDDITEK